MMPRKKSTKQTTKNKTPTKRETRKPEEITRRKEIVKLLSISERTLQRYMRRQGFPGLDADNKTLEEWYEVNRSNAGCKPGGHNKKTQAEIDTANALRLRKLETEVEKNEAAAGKHLEKAIEEYRDKAQKAIYAGLDIIFREIRRMDLSKVELERIKDAIADAKTRIKEGLNNV